VINNIERVANLFVTKSIYAAILAVVVGISAIPFPFYPRHLTIVSTLTIGVPGFFLALSSSSPRAQPGFVRRVLAFTVPAGTVAATATLLSYLVTRESTDAVAAQARTAATLALVAIGLAVLVLVARPLNTAKAALVGCMAGGAALTWALPVSRRIFSLEWPPSGALWYTAGIVLVTLPLLWILVARGARLEDRLSPRLLQ
jgi:cation-transporting ATPase E